MINLVKDKKLNIDELFRRIHNFYINNEKIINIILLIITFTILFLAFQTKEYYGDDFSYMTKWQSKIPITSVKDIIDYQITHYMLWGGRTVAHFILQVLFLIGKPTNAVISAFVYMLLSYLIYYYSFKNNRKPIYYFGVIGLLYFFNPNFEQTIMWYTGSANYMYTGLIILFSIKPFVEYLYDRNYKYKAIDYLSIVTCFFAGWSNENMAPTLILFMLFIIIKYKKEFSINVRMWISLTLVTIGTCFLLLAPGNFNRATAVSGILLNIATRVSGQINAWCTWLFPLFVIWLITKFVINNKKIQEYKSDIFVIWACISVLIMIFAPYFPSRAAFGPSLLMIIAILMNISRLIDDSKIIYISIISFLCWIAFNGTMIYQIVSAIAKNI